MNKRSLSWDEHIDSNNWIGQEVKIKKGEILQIFGIVNLDIWVHIIGEQYYTEQTYFKEKAYYSKKLTQNIDITFEAKETETIIVILDNEDAMFFGKDVSVKMSISRTPIHRDSAKSNQSIIEQMEDEIISNHFYLQNEDLSDFSRDIIRNAEYEIVAVNPYVDKGNITQELVKACQSGVDVTIVTRSPHKDSSTKKTKKLERSSFHRELEKMGIHFKYDNGVHAKILVADYSVAIISSMNLYAHSSGGGTWEAGIGTTEPAMIEKIKTSIFDSFKMQSMNQGSIEDYISDGTSQRCIDCGKSIPINPSKPRCLSCWRKMKRKY